MSRVRNLSSVHGVEALEPKFAQEHLCVVLGWLPRFSI